jgi:hypothetical protein
VAALSARLARDAPKLGAYVVEAKLVVPVALRRRSRRADEWRSRLARIFVGRSAQRRYWATPGAATTAKRLDFFPQAKLAMLARGLLNQVTRAVLVNEKETRE